MGANELLIDGLIILVYFVVIISIGLYMGRREDSLHDFALGGRNVPWWAVMASIIAAETSAATFLGVPGEGFKYRSIVYTQLAIGLILGRVVVGYFFLKPYYTYKVYTVYDFLAIRFGTRSKNYVSALFLIMRTLAMGVRVFVPSLVMVLAWKFFQNSGQPITFAIERAQEVDFSTAISQMTPYFVAIVLIVLLTCLYTAIGGIKAVIWTDVVQATLMFGSAIVAIITILYHIGGDSWNLMNGFRALGNLVPEMKTHEGYFWLGWEPSRVEAYVAAQSKIGRIINPDNLSLWEWIRLILASEYTIFSAVIGGTMGNIAAFGTDQDMVQRLLTAETYQKSRRSLITAAFMDLPIYACFSLIGVMLVAYYQQNARFLPPDNADVFGSYIFNVMPVGIRGLVLAGVFATAMGSLSAALNALATSLTNDWYIPRFGKGKSEAHHVTAARVFTALFAVLMILIATANAYIKVVDPDFRIIPFVIGIAGLLLGPMLGVFLVGMFTKTRGSDLGNVIAVTIGLIAMFFLSHNHVQAYNYLVVPAMAELGRELTPMAPPLWPSIAWTWYAMIGGLIVAGISVLFRTPAERVEYARHKAENAHLEEDVPMHLRQQIH